MTLSGEDKIQKSCSLTAVLQGNPEAVTEFNAALLARGWIIFKDYPSGYKKTVLNLMRQAENVLSVDLLRKKLPRSSHGLGLEEGRKYSTFRSLTGRWTPKTASLSALPLFSSQTDKLVRALLKCSATTFNLSRLKAPEKLPILDRKPANRYCILDILYFHSESSPKSDVLKEVVVQPHVLPGLFSLNLVNTQAGLEFWDREKNIFVPVPRGYPVLFCGMAATIISAGKIPPVAHRVLSPAKPRLSIWAQAGVSFQVSSRAFNEAHPSSLYNVQPVRNPKVTFAPTAKPETERTFKVRMMINSSTCVKKVSGDQSTETLRSLWEKLAKNAGTDTSVLVGRVKLVRSIKRQGKWLGVVSQECSVRTAKGTAYWQDLLLKDIAGDYGTIDLTQHIDKSIFGC